MKKELLKKKNIDRLNKDLQMLYNLLWKISANAVDEEMPETWEEVFGGVSDLIAYLDEAGTEDGIVPKFHTAEIVFEGDGTEGDLNQMHCALTEEYPEFIYDERREKCKHKDLGENRARYRCHFYGLWVGNPDSLVRMTHHAEGLYEKTNFENVHVEVRADKKWYGRK